MITSLRNLDLLTITHRASSFSRATRKSEITITGTTDIEANVQPYFDKMGKEAKAENYGLCSDDMRTVYTPTKVKTSDQFTLELADTAEIDGYTFVAMLVQSRVHNNGALRLSHYEVLFARKDKVKNYGD